MHSRTHLLYTVCVEGFSIHSGGDCQGRAHYQLAHAHVLQALAGNSLLVPTLFQHVNVYVHVCTCVCVCVHPECQYWPLL